MRFAFFAVAAYAACYEQAQSNCTAAMNCTWVPAFCQRDYVGSTPCSTTSTNCTGADCGVGSWVSNPKTCSKCSDTCGTHKDNSTCIASGACDWNAGWCQDVYVAPPTPEDCDDIGVATTCAAKAMCMWVEFTDTTCGTPSTKAFCTSCNTSHAVTHQLAAFKDRIGSTCTWPKSGEHTADYVITPKVLSRNSQCEAFPDHGHDDHDEMDEDFGKLVSDLASGALPASKMSCKSASNAASGLLPSLALLALAALF